MGTVSLVGRNGATKVFKHGEKAYSHHFLLTVPGSSRVDLFSRLRNKPEELNAR